MSLNLRLLVLRHETDLKHHVIDPVGDLYLDQDYSILSRISRPNGDATQDDPKMPRSDDVPVYPLPEQLQIRVAQYNSPATRSDRYGKELTYTHAGELGRLPDPEPEETTKFNRAILAFVRALPPNLPVVLYWH
ncbi:MAG: hypothetical protein AAB655_00630 [Patescibacteria group bacterium]